MRKVLFICSANLDRSPTAERIFNRWKGKWVAKSAGIIPSLGRNSITQELIDWADLILVMELIHAQYIHTQFRCDSSKVQILNIGNKFVGNNPELIQELKNKVPQILKFEEKNISDE